MFLCLINLSNSSLVLILRVPSLSFVGPEIFLSTFLSHSVNLFLIVSFKTHVSQAYVTIASYILLVLFHSTYTIFHFPFMFLLLLSC